MDSSLFNILKLLVLLALLLQTAWAAEPGNPWPAMFKITRRARPSALYHFWDYELPKTSSMNPVSDAGRFCNCRITSGYNQTFLLNTASAVFRGELYLVILQRTVTIQAGVTFFSNSKKGTNQILEANSLWLCKTRISNGTKVYPKDCKLIEPEGYQETHPLKLHPILEPNGLMDPRLISAGDEHGLFLQAGCRPAHMMAANTGFKEGLCFIKLLDGVPASSDTSIVSDSQEADAQTGQATQTAAGSGQDAPVPISGMTMWSKDLQIGRLISVTHENTPREKNWAPFAYKGNVLWTRHLSPHQVVTMHHTGNTTTLFSQENQEVFAHLNSICGKGPRGNTPQFFMPKEVSGLTKDFYIGVLHWTPRRGGYPDSFERACHEYLNFFYLMEAEPPFNILEVSRTPIPLLSATNPVYDSPPLYWGFGYISFPTGLVVMNNQVIITYGSGDSQVRVWHAGLQDVLETFLLVRDEKKAGAAAALAAALEANGTTTAAAATATTLLLH